LPSSSPSTQKQLSTAQRRFTQVLSECLAQQTLGSGAGMATKLAGRHRQ
jgi:hypothetical protein